MKVRKDFVTNSSSSSFILHNNTDKDLNCREFVMELMKQILDDAEAENITIPAHGSTKIECSDHLDDGAFEYFIHNVVGNDWASNGCFEYRSDGVNYFEDCPVSVKFNESHH